MTDLPDYEPVALESHEDSVERRARRVLIQPDPETRAGRRIERRRRRVRRVLRLAIPVLAIIIIAGLLAYFLGTGRLDCAGSGQGGDDDSAAALARSVTVVAVTQANTVVDIVILAPKSTGGVAVGMPASTLVRTDQGFQNLGELAKEGGEQLLQGLNSVFAAQATMYASLDWTSLVSVVGQAGSADSPAATLSDTPDGARSAASSVLAAVKLRGTAAGAGKWAQLAIHQGRGDLEAYAKSVAASVASGGWRVESLPGRMVTGSGFTYFEADITASKALLGRVASTTSKFKIEVQNGSGMINAAQQAGSLLSPYGYTMLPYKNADAFPDVTRTDIKAASDAIPEANIVRDILGIGIVEEDTSLSSMNIRVIVGKDFSLSPAGTSTTTG